MTRTLILAEGPRGRRAQWVDELKREAVELVRSSGRSMADVASSLGIADTTLSNWVQADRRPKPERLILDHATTTGARS